MDEAMIFIFFSYYNELQWWLQNTLVAMPALGSSLGSTQTIVCMRLSDSHPYFPTLSSFSKHCVVGNKFQFQDSTLEMNPNLHQQHQYLVCWTVPTQQPMYTIAASALSSASGVCLLLIRIPRDFLFSFGLETICQHLPVSSLPSMLPVPSFTIEENFLPP